MSENPLSLRHPRLTPTCLLGALLMATPLAQADQNTGVHADDDAPVIALINPNSNQDATQSMTELARLEAQGAATLVGHTNTSAPALLTTPREMDEAAAGVVTIGIEAAEDERVAALIVAAFSDPGLDELRGAVDIPVFGIGEEVFHEAARDERAFGIVTVTPDEALIDSFRQKAAALGYAHLYRGTWVTPGDPTELVQSADRLDAALAEAVRTAIAEDDVQAVIMGGGPLSEPALRLQPQFDVPLVVAVNAATRAAIASLQEAR